MQARYIYAAAVKAQKGDWRVYNRLKHLLTENLSPNDYAKFCELLAEILEL